jgi:hypothetical protein
MEFCCWYSTSLDYYLNENEDKKDEESRTQARQMEGQNERQKIFLMLGCEHNSRRTTIRLSRGTVIISL